jgi:hypothetical protein
MKKYLLFFLFFVMLFEVIAQSENISIEWGEDINISTEPDKVIIVYGFNNKYFDYSILNKQITYSRTFNNLKDQNYLLTNIRYEDATVDELKGVESFQTDFESKVSINRARNNRYLTVSFNPYVRQDGVVKRVVGYTLQSTSQRPDFNKSNFNTQGIQNSVLANGNWYKFYVEETGVYRLTYAFLSQLGLNLSGINSDQIKIYSHGGAMLPLLNAENLHYDPPQLPLQVFDGNDGQFDPGDFVLLYAESTIGWNEESQTHINAYADRAFYYATLNNDLPNRIPTLQNLTATPSEVITSYDDFKFYEVDETSLSLVGRRWFGDRFDIETERTYEFDFNNIIPTEPLTYQMEFGAISSVSSVFGISINGAEVNSAFIGPNGDSLPSNGSGVTSQTTVSSDEVSVTLNYNKNGNPGARGFLDYIRLGAKCELRADGEQFIFQNLDISNTTTVVEYQIDNATNISQVWKIDDLTSISAYQNTEGNASFSVITNHNSDSKFLAISPDDYFTPSILQSDRVVENQNLKGTIFNDAQGNFQDVDYIILTRSDFLSHANRLADLRRNANAFNVKVVGLENVYTEFSSGKQDITAIRNFMKYIYDNASSEDNRIKYLCLLGDTSVDYKNRLQGNNNIVPTYQSLGSFSTTRSSFMSDDFYTLMDANEGRMTNSDKMDFAVGRIVVDTQEEAKQAIDKIVEYESRASYDDWRNDFILISDDVDENWEHQSIQVNLDNLGDDISLNKPNINVIKIHSDAYQQQTSAGGNRYPTVNKEINERTELGATVINYFGHGGEEGLAQERIVTQSSVQSWQNPNRYNVFLTITCEFTRFDNPLRISAGELAYRNPDGGPVSMITTTRAITVTDGVDFNQEMAPFLFDYAENQITVGEAVRLAKNELSSNGRRIVFYIGDPALRIPFPEPNIRLTRVNDIPVSAFNDTLKALSKNKFSGEIIDDAGNKITNYNGVLSATLFDKRIERSTLANDGTRSNQGELLIMDFTTLGEILFRGQASVTNGEFEFEFVLPKDTRIPVDNGRVSLYAVRNNVLEDQSGFSNEILIGDIDENAPQDNQGPIIQLFMNEESFVDGEITDDSPFLLANLQDDSGINTAGGIGHDIVAILDGDEANPIILNEFYEAEVDDFTRGEVMYKLRDLEDGLHTISFKAWDTYNNSSTAEITFRVANNEGLDISRVLNYPNPFVDYTEFWFHHNQPFQPLNVQVQVFTVTGKVVWTHNETITTDSFLAREITWDGRDDFGDQIGKGVYIYKLTVESPTINKKIEKFEKLVKL